MEIGAFYLASHSAYTLAKEMADGVEIIANPMADYKKTAEKCGLGVRGANDLIFSPEFGSLMALGAVCVKGQRIEKTRDCEPLQCEKCGACKKLCPVSALDKGFSYSTCIRRQMDDGIESWAENKLSKSVLGCNFCSEFCIKNNQNRVRPPEILQNTLQIDNFFELALTGRKALEPLGELIGKNMIRPAKMLTLATYALQNLDKKYFVWLDKLREYPDERVKRAVMYIESLKIDK